MKSKDVKENYNEFMTIAFLEAMKGYEEGGIPVGAIIVQGGKVIATGYNKRVQKGDPIAHGEMDCLRNLGRKPNYNEVTLYTTLSPCMMCSGTILQFGIKNVVVGENINFRGNIDFLQTRGTNVVLLNDEKCIGLMKKFISEKPDIWNEDVSGNDF
jgi:cytosine/creatinine deaminase